MQKQPGINMIMIMLLFRILQVKLHIQTETEKFDAELVSGVSYARTKGVKHNVVNQNDHEFVFVEIELK